MSDLALVADPVARLAMMADLLDGRAKPPADWGGHRSVGMRSPVAHEWAADARLAVDALRAARQAETNLESLQIALSVVSPDELRHHLGEILSRLQVALRAMDAADGSPGSTGS